MKYQNLAAFEKHLREAAPANLSLAYMVISPDLRERLQILEKVAGLALTRGGEKRIIRLGEEKEGFESCCALFQSPPLLASSWVIVLDGIEQLKKLELEKLSLYLQKPAPFITLIMGSAKMPLGFYEPVKKELVLLDMGGEKPWEKKKRVKEWLVAEAAKEKKAFADEAALFLIDSVGLERGVLEQELFKLITFAYERKGITLQDVRIMTASTQSAGLWKLAEQLVWEDIPLPREPVEDLSAVIAMTSFLRSQLDIGLRLSSLIERGMPSHEIETHFPSLRQQAFERAYSVCKRRGTAFFTEALILTFHTELDAKNQPPSAELLWDLLISKIIVLKHASTPSQSSR